MRAALYIIGVVFLFLVYLSFLVFSLNWEKSGKDKQGNNWQWITRIKHNVNELRIDFGMEWAKSQDWQENQEPKDYITCLPPFNHTAHLMKMNYAATSKIQNK